MSSSSSGGPRAHFWKDAASDSRPTIRDIAARVMVDDNQIQWHQSVLEKLGVEVDKDGGVCEMQGCNFEEAADVVDDDGPPGLDVAPTPTARAQISGRGRGTGKSTAPKKNGNGGNGSATPAGPQKRHLDDDLEEEQMRDLDEDGMRRPAAGGRRERGVTHQAAGPSWRARRVVECKSTRASASGCGGRGDQGSDEAEHRGAGRLHLLARVGIGEGCGMGAATYAWLQAVV